MSEKTILLDEAAFNIGMTLPRDWGQPDAVGIRVTNMGGSDLLSTDVQDADGISEAGGGTYVSVDLNDTSEYSVGDYCEISGSNVTAYNGVWKVLEEDGHSLKLDLLYITDPMTTITAKLVHVAPFASDDDTLDGAVSRGAFTATISGSATYKAGELVRVGVLSEGFDYLVVRDFTESTKKLTFEKRFDRDHASGSSIVSREVSFDFDTTGSDWDSIGSATVSWIPFGIDKVPFTELVDVLKRSVNWEGLDEHFMSRFPRLYEIIKESWDHWTEDAYLRLKQWFEIKGIDLARAVDSPYFRESMLLEIALMVCEQGGEALKDEYEMIAVRWKQQQTVMSQLFIWVDEDQDLAKDDSEVKKARVMGFSRGL